MRCCTCQVRDASPQLEIDNAAAAIRHELLEQVYDACGKQATSNDYSSFRCFSVQLWLTDNQIRLFNQGMLLQVSCTSGTAVCFGLP